VSCGATVEPAQIPAAKATVGEVMANTETTLHRGRVKSFSEVNGYGFILRNNESDQGADLFFHVSAIANNWRPKSGHQVTFEIAPSRQRDGRPHAINVKPLDE